MERVDYSKIVKIGDRVRSWDFEPIPHPDYPDRYVEGVIEYYYADVGLFKMIVDKDTAYPEDPRDVVHFPAHMLFDFPNRVEIL